MLVYPLGFFGGANIRAERMATSNEGAGKLPLASPVFMRQDESGLTPGKVPP